MIVFDSSVLIAHLRIAGPATEAILAASSGGGAGCSVLSRIEVAGGMRSEERHDVRRLFSSLRCIPVSDEIASRAAELMRTYRRSHSGIDLTDYVIAATVQVMGAELQTLNIKHFPMFEGLQPAF